MAFAHDDEEAQSLLPMPSAAIISEKEIDSSFARTTTRRSFNCLHLSGAFVLGLAASFAAQQLPLFRPSPSFHAGSDASRPVAYASPWAGSTVREPFPPVSPTNAFPSLFPTNVGHAGPTPTGAEAGLVATAPVLPVYTQAPHLVAPLVVSKEAQGAVKDGKSGGEWDLFKKWGNLSPWYSVPRGAFGIDAGGEAPEGCQVTGLHLLHRHGARYPTGWGISTHLILYMCMIFITNSQLAMVVRPTSLLACMRLPRSGRVRVNSLSSTSGLTSSAKVRP
jgi:hypothetical protein